MFKNQLRVLFGLELITFASACPLLAQTKPSVLSVGPNKPTSAIFIGNSFFYYNNGINGHVTNFVQAGEPGKALRSTMVTISGQGGLSKSMHPTSSCL